MNGEALYQLYVKANNDNGIGVDAWLDLEDMDTAVWDRLAQLLEKVK